MSEAKPLAAILTPDDAREFLAGVCGSICAVLKGPRSNELRLQVAPERTIVITVAMGSW